MWVVCTFLNIDLCVLWLFIFFLGLLLLLAFLRGFFTVYVFEVGIHFLFCFVDLLVAFYFEGVFSMYSLVLFFFYSIY